MDDSDRCPPPTAAIGCARRGDGQRSAARPKLPGIPGIETYQGHTFHTSRWDYAYTGGDSSGGLDGLADKRVGIIGTGATAVQCVPHLGEGAKELFVFQRTPSSIDVRDNRATDPEWAASLEPGWQRRRMENFNNLVSGVFEPEDMVNDGWTDIIGKLLIMMRRGAIEAGTDPGEAVELADFEKMESIRHVETMVTRRGVRRTTPVLQAAVLPRRVPSSTDQRHPVDTHGQRRADHRTASSPTASNTSSTASSTRPASRSAPNTPFDPYELYGRTATLTDGGRRCVHLHGMHSRGFSRTVLSSATCSRASRSTSAQIDEQSRHLAYILQHLPQDVRVVEASVEAEAEWVRSSRSSQNNQKFLEAHAATTTTRASRSSAARNSSYGAGDQVHRGARAVA
jgi:cyclohexanone monooxygenase